MNKIKRFAYKLLNIIEYLFFFKKFESILKKSNIEDKKKLLLDHSEAFEDLVNFSNKKEFESFGFDKEFFFELTLKTQTVIKKNKLNFFHGFLLQFFLSKYIDQNKDYIKTINIFEIGTARGYSSLCMSKILKDKNIKGKIFTGVQFQILKERKKEKICYLNGVI